MSLFDTWAVAHHVAVISDDDWVKDGDIDTFLHSLEMEFKFPDVLQNPEVSLQSSIQMLNMPSDSWHSSRLCTAGNSVTTGSPLSNFLEKLMASQTYLSHLRPGKPFYMPTANSAGLRRPRPAKPIFA